MLFRSCLDRGVEITRPARVLAVVPRGDRIDHVHADIAGTTAEVRGRDFILAAGAWSEAFARQLGARIATRPVRGQIALLRLPSQHHATEARLPFERMEVVQC